MRSLRRYILVPVIAVCAVFLLCAARPATAQSVGAFSIQVTPSPLVTTVKPGETTTLELKVRNAGPATEDLKIVARSFRVDNATQQLKINEDQEPEIASWVKFSPPTFTIPSGQTATEKITISVPKEAGFSYAFAMVISRVNDGPQPVGERAIKPSVAIFALMNVDRPGAVRALEISKFTSTKGSYEYLPAEFEVEFKNTGNTIVQPAGSLFVQRGSNDAKPIDELQVNDAGGYILPGSTRTIKMRWDNGFLVNEQMTDETGKTTEQLVWNWNKLGDVRIGQYTAKLVAIYNDGVRDVPLEAEVKFWVFPWMIALIILAVAAFIGFGIWSLISKIIGFGKRIKQPKKRLRL
jgi:hypothetical protein